MAVSEIGRRDLVWSVMAVLFRYGAGVLLFPLILNRLPAETVGVWTIFTNIAAIIYLLDFGFNSSFARNVAYVFSGVRQLSRTGHETVADTSDDAVDYSLLKSTIAAMRYFYSRMALGFFILLSTLGTLYVYLLLEEYGGDRSEVYAAWVILCFLCTYNLYTLYYESLMTGRGLVKEYNRYVLAGNVVYVALAALLIMLGAGLVAIVSAQAVSIVVIRCLSSRRFFTRELWGRLAAAEGDGGGDVLRIISHNAVKVGLNVAGAFVISRAATFVGSMYVGLDEMASYGVTLQLMLVVTAISCLYSKVFMPKVFQWRVEGRPDMVRRTYVRSELFFVTVFAAACMFIYFCGNPLFGLLGSHTQILGGGLLAVFMLTQFLESNHGLASDYLLSKNEVPFYKASLWTAGATVVLLVISVVWMDMGLWGMVLAPGVAQLCYQNWKWPAVTVRELFCDRVGREV